MADKVSAIKPQRLDSAAVKENPPAPAKFYSNFLFRALVAVVFFVLIPVFPSIAPEFVTQTFFTESWELIHIIFVGIAVSYGLFSRRYDDSGGESPTKIDASQSYVSKLLQASSVFDEDSDSPTGSFDDGGSKVQAWSSQYFRNEPAVVVAKKESSSAFSGRKTDPVSAMGDDKPLLLPVRSLRSRIPDESGDGDSRVSSKSYSRSSSYGSSSAPTKPLNWEKKIRSGSLKSRTPDVNGALELSGSLSPSSKNLSSKGVSTRTSTESLNERSSGDMDEENVVVLPSPIPWRSRSGGIEMKEAVNPPPSSKEEMDPDQSSISKASRSPRVSSDSSPGKAFYSSASLLESQAKRSEDSTRRKAIYRSSPPPPPPPPPPPVPLYKPSSIKPNSRMANANDVLTVKENETSRVDSSPPGKSVRTVRGWQEPAEEQNERESPFSDHENETGDFFGEVLATSDDDENDSEHDEADGYGGEAKKPENVKEEVDNSSGANADDEGPDVDKKADEFIAKFREQIRLQRIESIKRSTGQFSKNSTR